MMNELKEMQVNFLPRKTWHWCKVNDASIKVETENVKAAKENIVKSAGILSETRMGEDEYRSLESGMGKEFADYGFEVSKSIQKFRAENTDNGENLLIELSYEDGASYFNSYRIEAAPETDLTVIMRYKEASSDEEKPGEELFTAGIDTRVNVGRKATVRLIQVHESPNACIYNNIASKVDESGSFEVIHVILNGKKVYNGCAAELSGKRSNFNVDTGYIAKENAKVDFNYVARHKGKESTSEIFANGVLNKQADKTFRGTLDFITGCPGSKGAEKEDVLLLDDDIINKTVPLILCTEEDVEGEHGATIGKLSDEILFYLNSKGINDDLAYSLMATGRVASVIRKIDNEELVKELLDRLGVDSK